MGLTAYLNTSIFPVIVDALKRSQQFSARIRRRPRLGELPSSADLVLRILQRDPTGNGYSPPEIQIRLTSLGRVSNLRKWRHEVCRRGLQFLIQAELAVERRARYSASGSNWAGLFNDLDRRLEALRILITKWPRFFPSPFTTSATREERLRSVSTHPNATYYFQARERLVDDLIWFTSDFTQLAWVANSLAWGDPYICQMPNWREVWRPLDLPPFGPRRPEHRTSRKESPFPGHSARKRMFADWSSVKRWESQEAWERERSELQRSIQLFESSEPGFQRRNRMLQAYRRKVLEEYQKHVNAITDSPPGSGPSQSQRS